MGSHNARAAMNNVQENDELSFAFITILVRFLVGSNSAFREASGFVFKSVKHSGCHTKPG
jgi:hypothetical protein